MVICSQKLIGQARCVHRHLVAPGRAARAFKLAVAAQRRCIVYDLHDQLVPYDQVGARGLIG